MTDLAAALWAELDKLATGEYPSEEIGGGNPYRRCSSCGVSAPQINGVLGGHAADCTWAADERCRLMFGVVTGNTSEENCRIKAVVYRKLYADLVAHNREAFPRGCFVEVDGSMIGCVCARDNGMAPSHIPVRLCNDNTWHYEMSRVRRLRPDERHRIGTELRWRILKRAGMADKFPAGTGFTKVSREWSARDSIMRAEVDPTQNTRHDQG